MIHAYYSKITINTHDLHLDSSHQNTTTHPHANGQHHQSPPLHHPSPPPPILLHRRFAQSDPAAISEFLNGHNTLRASCNLPPLQWSTALASYARWWANQRKGDCAMMHSSSNYGENIFWGQGDDWTPTEAVQAWEDEAAYYNYGSNTCMPNRDCSHYTQMVWGSTTSVGCAKIKCLSGDTFIVCEYDPHGNIYGLRPY